MDQTTTVAEDRWALVWPISYTHKYVILSLFL